MILNRVYEDFMSHTNLTDPVYKSVFQKLSDIITNINSVKWKRLIFTMNTNVYDIDFESNRVLPSHILDLFQNVFEHNFQFPTDSTTIIQLEYNNNPYEIRVEGGIVVAPSELNFLMYSNIFSFYYVNNPVDDLFEEFNSLFKVIDTFKTKQFDVYSSLKKQFENQFVATAIEEQGVKKDSYVEDMFVLESMEINRNDILKKLEAIQAEKESITAKRMTIVKGAENREKYINNRNMLQEEYKQISASHADYKETLDEYDKVIKELNDGIEGINASMSLTTDPDSLKQLESDKEYFINKRLIFNKEVLATKRLMLDTQRIGTDIQTSLTALNNELATIEGYTTNDVAVIDSRIYQLTIDYEGVYSQVLNIDQDIKVKKDQINAGNSLRDKSSSLMDVNVQMVEKKDVVDHLMKSTKPQAVIVVENYLRYYYVYHVKKAVEAIKDESGMNNLELNTIMSRNVLETYFGIQPYTLFSTIQYNPKATKNFVNVTRG